ncbi:MAG TPA: helix-turn-helix domain-containing protein [Mycobacteriales bacterium]|nr:helix-turn-helix domain-containing protein [Mycobacteriales bacterium]
MDDSVRRLDARGLKALAHPLRVRMLGTLRSDGPATATQLAQRLGESTGTTSWHLRQLAEHGFIEEDPERGTKRDRWWRARTRYTQLDVADFAQQPELLGTLGVYLQSVLEQHFRRASDFIEHGDRWLPDWQEAANFSDWTLRLDPAGLEALNAEMAAVIERYRRVEPTAAAEAVQIQLHAFPHGPGGQA